MQVAARFQFPDWCYFRQTFRTGGLKWEEIKKGLEFAEKWHCNQKVRSKGSDDRIAQASEEEAVKS